MAIESRIHERVYLPAAAGKSVYLITCPFCGIQIEARAWSLAGGGKRCECGAMHGFLRNVTTKET